MKIKSLTLQNFRSFGPAPTTIELNDLTGFVGTNSCGKSTVLQALTRLFGITNSERALQRGDFHVPRDKVPDEIDSIELFIEARLEFGELEVDGDPGMAVPEYFRHMLASEPGEMPYCRARMEGKWSRGNLPGGEIDENRFWIRSPDEVPKDDHKQKMLPHERSRIHVHYVPAARDPLRQIRQASGTIMHRLFNAVNWTDGIRPSVETSSDKLSEEFKKEPGIELIRTAVTSLWKQLHPLEIYSEVHLRPLSRRFEEFLSQVEAVFGPAPVGREHGAERLSDGLKSLFYLTLIGAIFDLECKTPVDIVPKDENDKVAPHGISRDKLDPPSLTILAVEEPENHLAPHYLGRIMQALRKVAESPNGQVILTSHSTSIMRRVEPEEVRYLRLDPAAHTTLVRSIELPADTSDAHKFVREAVRSYPELYFAKLVVLGEGESEEIVLPRIAECLGVPIDSSFVSIVPLGGKHVNHFWRLLSGLDIPYVTLLDLDREREGGGWGRIKYVAKQMIELGKPRETFLRIVPGADSVEILSNKALEEMHTWEMTKDEHAKSLQAWVSGYESHGIYFSAPLDLDFLMQQSFPAAYKVIPEGGDGPDIPGEHDADRDDEIKAAIKAVLKKKGSGGSTYTDDEKTAFFWYRYLFLGRGKPTTHIQALGNLDDAQLSAKCPDVLRRLVARMREHLIVVEAEEAAAMEAADAN